MQMPDISSRLLADSLRHRQPAPVSQLMLAVPPRAYTPTSNERITAEADAIRHQGFSGYA
jgi:hypothetical protein